MLRKFGAAFLVLSLLTAGCGGIHLSTPTSAHVLTILSDAQWGVNAAHDQEWLTDEEFTIFSFTILTAQDAVHTSPEGAIAVTRQVLEDTESFLGPASRLRPYFDAALILLQ